MRRSDRGCQAIDAPRAACRYLSHASHRRTAKPLAIQQGAHCIEPDLVISEDGVLLTRHEPMLMRVDLDGAGHIVWRLVGRGFYGRRDPHRHPRAKTAARPAHRQQRLQRPVRDPDIARSDRLGERPEREDDGISPQEMLRRMGARLDAARQRLTAGKPRAGQ